MIDTTGSMSDELSYLQAEVADVIHDVREKVGQSVKIRLSVNFYRDHGDAYVVRKFPFTEDIDAAIADLGAQSADGGGDFPEAVVEALDAAVFESEWSASARSRLCFLVLDAPPHAEEDGIGSMQVSLEAAAKLGIRVIPVAASGVDKSTEFFLRMADILTGGTYVFLTSHSGIGGEHIEPTIGEYQVELLNALLSRLIVQSLQDG
ncbi:MAG: VWA domain-containing protein [Nannocystis sp.]|nr:VWA domain-containing protein [Nannocystis sp.]